jgi:hypothetical protein
MAYFEILSWYLLVGAEKNVLITGLKDSDFLHL